MRTLSLVVISCSFLLAAGCGEKKEETAEKPKYDTGLKELVTKDLVVGKPTEFQPKMKPIEDGDRVYVRYKGVFSDGLEFDSNLDESKPPFAFTVGRQEVIKGWDEGIKGMLPGGKRKLDVPWSMGYGEKSMQPSIPNKADLFFEVEVIDVVKVGQEETYHIKDRKVGTGAEAKRGSTVTVEYEVRIPGDDHIWDSSTIQGIKPSFVIGSDKAQPVIEDGIIGMKVGGERDLYIPYTLAPRVNRVEGYPGETSMIFKVKLLSVK